MGDKSTERSSESFDEGIYERRHGVLVMPEWMFASQQAWRNAVFEDDYTPDNIDARIREMVGTW